MSFFTKACISVLKEIPEVNAEIKNNNIIYKNRYDIGGTNDQYKSTNSIPYFYFSLAYNTRISCTNSFLSWCNYINAIYSTIGDIYR